MNRSIDARMDRIERVLGAASEDEFGLSKLSDNDLSRLLHSTLGTIAANEQRLFSDAAAVSSAMGSESPAS